MYIAYHSWQGSLASLQSMRCRSWTQLTETELNVQHNTEAQHLKWIFCRGKMNMVGTWRHWILPHKCIKIENIIDRPINIISEFKYSHSVVSRLFVTWTATSSHHPLQLLQKFTQTHIHLVNIAHPTISYSAVPFSPTHKSPASGSYNILCL